MSLTFRARKFVTFALLALLLPAWAASGLPLVWCVGPNGHNAIKALTLGDCHDAPEASFRAGKLSAKNGNCTDFSLWQRAEAPRKLFSDTPPPPDPTAVGALPEAVHGNPECGLQGFCIQFDFVANQLAQLRTVVLLI